MHLSQKQLEIERNGRNLGITWTVHDNRISFEHFENFKILFFLKKLKNPINLHLFQKQLEIERDEI